MGLYSGVADFLIECICKNMTAEDVTTALDIFYEPDIGTLQMFVNKNLPVNGDILDSVASIAYKEGWVYPNGKFIAKNLYPKMFEYLDSFDYVGKQKSVHGSTEKITLPTIQGMFKLDPNIHNDRLSYVYPQRISIPAHQHDFTFDSSSSKELIVKNGCWIWSTKSPGTSGTFEGTSWTDKYGCTVEVTKASSFHGGNPGTGNKKTITWDLPVKVNTSVKTHIDSVTSGVITDNKDPTTKIMPARNDTQILIYIGKPQL